MKTGLLALPFALQGEFGPLPFTYNRQPVVVLRTESSVFIQFFNAWFNLLEEWLLVAEFHAIVPTSSCEVTLWAAQADLPTDLHDPISVLHLRTANRLSAEQLAGLVACARRPRVVAGPLADTEEVKEEGFRWCLERLLWDIEEEGRRVWREAGGRGDRIQPIWSGGPDHALIGTNHIDGILRCPRCGGDDVRVIRRRQTRGLGTTLSRIRSRASMPMFGKAKPATNNLHAADCNENGHRCLLCEYRWIQRPGEELPMASNPELRVQGQERRDAEQSRLRSAAQKAIAADLRWRERRRHIRELVRQFRPERSLRLRRAHAGIALLLAAGLLLSWPGYWSNPLAAGIASSAFATFLTLPFVIYGINQVLAHDEARRQAPRRRALQLEFREVSATLIRRLVTGLSPKSEVPLFMNFAVEGPDAFDYKLAQALSLSTGPELGQDLAKTLGPDLKHALRSTARIRADLRRLLFAAEDALPPETYAAALRALKVIEKVEELRPWLYTKPNNVIQEVMSQGVLFPAAEDMSRALKDLGSAVVDLTEAEMRTRVDDERPHAMQAILAIVDEATRQVPKSRAALDDIEGMESRLHRAYAILTDASPVDLSAAGEMHDTYDRLKYEAVRPALEATRSILRGEPDSEHRGQLRESLGRIADYVAQLHAQGSVATSRPGAAADRPSTTTTAQPGAQDNTENEADDEEEEDEKV